MSGSIARLAGVWKVKNAERVLESLVQNLNTDAKLSSAAVEGLVSLKSTESRSVLARLGGADQPFTTRLRAAAGYAQSSPGAAISMVVAALSDAGPKDDARPLIRPYLSNARMSDALAKGLSGVKIDGDVARALVQQLVKRMLPHCACATPHHRACCIVHLLTIQANALAVTFHT